MHPQSIASFTSPAANITLMLDVKMGFTVSPHVPPIGKLLSTSGAGKLGPPLCLADHTVQDCGKVYTYRESVLL